MVGGPWRKDGLKILTTDASRQGWGAHIGHHFFQGQWGPNMDSWSSNFRELAAIFQGIQNAGDLLIGSHVQIQSDNSTVKAYINKQGGTRNQELMNLSFKIFSLAERFLSLYAVFLTGRENRQADSQSTAHSPRRLLLRQGGLPKNYRPLGKTADRPLCHQEKPPSKELLLPKPIRPPLGHRCLFHKMELESGICLSRRLLLFRKF